MRILQAQPLTLRTLAAASTSTSYVDVGSALEINVARLNILNDTDGDMIVSLDGGTSDHDIVLAGERYEVINGQEDLTIPGGSQVAVKQSGAAPTSGTVYVSGHGQKSSF